jgi:phosphoribosylanthranilate isomerase
VGVFVDASLDEVGDAVRLAGLTEVQLHGGESRAYCSRLREFVPGVRVVKTLHVGDAFDPASVASYAGTVDAILLDTLVPGARGGTGAAFDWALARTLPRDVALYLAGGLAPHSVAEAMSVAAPDGVDVSSGVESTPGEKDPTRIDAFVAAVRGADATTTDMTKDE